MWTVYILQCADNTLYTGITVEIERRIEEHNTSPKGSKYTRPRRPVRVVYQKKFPDKSSASTEEMRIKKLSREKKLEMISKK